MGFEAEHSHFGPIGGWFWLLCERDEGEQRDEFPPASVQDAKLSGEIDGKMAYPCTKAILGPGQVAVENDFVGIANDIVGAEKECALFL